MKLSADIVRQSWKNVLPMRDDAAALFFTRLFELDPSLRPFFKGDMAEHHRKWGAIISVAVANLERSIILLPSLYTLGAQQEKNGIQDHHYDVVGAALLDTLQRIQGEAFTPEVRVAWVDAYRVIASVMKTAAADYHTLAA
ncbi:MAG: globin domain-containing protein [Casimicrobium sp.]|jgi:hemoglobin-like flavoprotein